MMADGGWRMADSVRNGNGGRRASMAVLSALLLISSVGCGQPQANVRMPATQKPGKADEPPKADAAAAPNLPSAITSPPAPTGGRNPQLPAGFGPVKIGILPLTELSGASGAGQRAKLNAFVAMLDAFGSQVKAPGVLRFELYEYVPRSAQSKGPRLALWPDIDLSSPAENNRYWRDFLRAYEFELDAQAGRDKTYVLEVTCLCPDGKRLSSEYTFRGSP